MCDRIFDRRYIMSKATVRKLPVFLTVCTLCVVSNIPAFCDDLFSGEIGVSPNTMGTVGESFSFAYRPITLFALRAEGSHDTIYKRDVEVTRVGTKLSEDIYRDSYNGSAGAELSLRLGIFRAAPYVSWGIDRSVSEIDAKVVDTGSPLGIGGFREYAIRDTTTTISIGSDLDIDLGKTGVISLSGAWAPLRFGNSEEDRFLTSPRKDTSDWNADYDWFSSSVSMTTEGQGWSASLDYDFSLPAIGKLSARGNYEQRTSGSEATFDNIDYWLGKAITSSDWAINQAATSGKAKISVVESSFKAGLSLSLDFVKKALSLKGAPILSCDYSLLTRENTHNYYEILEKDYWRERYDWVQFGIKWGM
jgi:hypothetical protein